MEVSSKEWELQAIYRSITKKMVQRKSGDIFECHCPHLIGHILPLSFSLTFTALASFLLPSSRPGRMHLQTRLLLHRIYLLKDLKSIKPGNSKLLDWNCPILGRIKAKTHNANVRTLRYL